VHLRLDAPQTPDVGERPGNGATLGLSSLRGAERLGVLAVAVAAGRPPLLLQPAATNPSRATASATAPVAEGGPAAPGEGSRDILTELSGPLPARLCERERRPPTRADDRCRHEPE
jgi:hypothetical protein